MFKSADWFDNQSKITAAILDCCINHFAEVWSAFIDIFCQLDFILAD